MLLDQLAQTDSYAYAKSLIQKYTEQARISLQNAFQDDPSAIRIFESLLAHLMDRET